MPNIENDAPAAADDGRDVRLGAGGDLLPARLLPLDQWFFLKLYDMGLAYRKESPVDFCPQCNTTLAREQVWGEDRTASGAARR